MRQEQLTLSKAQLVPEQWTPAITLGEVSKRHLRGGRSLEVLANINLIVGEGEFIAIMGPSGSGKTTLLNLIGGLDRPSGGRLSVRGCDPSRMTNRELAQWHASDIGFVFQFYNLIPVLTAQQNVELPLSLRGQPRAERRRRAEGALKLVGLADRGGHRPYEMSGGEQQRVAIARAVVGAPWLLLCDEPTGDLDRETAAEVMELLDILHREHNKTIILVTHDAKVAEHADRIIRLDKGVVVGVDHLTHA